jgi:hypothetical protein
MQALSGYWQWITLGNLAIGVLALCLSAISTVVAVKSYRTRRPPIGILAEHTQTTSTGWNCFMLTFRNELPSAVRVDEIRSKWPAEGLLFAENIDGPEVLYSARLSPGWRIDAATDRWAQLERRIFVWRPQSLRLGERPRKVALEFKLTPQDARWRQMRMTKRTAAIRWS